MVTPLHPRLTLYTEGNEKYIFAPADAAGQWLSVHRDEGDIFVEAANSARLTTQGRTVFGIVGVISLSISDYIIIITGREPKGDIMGQEIYHATDFDILPISTKASVSNPAHPVEAHLLALVKSHLKSGNFLFSYTWDLTRRMQAQWQNREKDQGKAMWEVADDRFFWNRFLQSRLIDQTTSTRSDFSPFILPIIYGSFDARPARLNGHSIHFALISRRSRFRAGTRYFKRGIDEEGHVANFNETEQIVTVDSPGGEDTTARMSYVQIRGSIPLFWAEINNLRYMPDLQIMDLQNTGDAMRTHLEEQVGRYGPTALVNLINHKGHEKPIKEEYERYMRQLDLPDVRYQYFDFHSECSRMRWDRISLLIEDMESDLTTQGYFHLDVAQDAPVKLQKGIIRTNCMDNLDRTNVSQAAFAKWNLDKQLKAIGVMNENDSITLHEDLDSVFRILWSDHANFISTAYSGTPALKTDFTRTGKRTRKGAFEDFSKSAMRYLKNNYFDGPRQDAFDLFTGSFVPRRGPATLMPLVTDNRPLLVRAMPYVAWYSLFMIFAGLTLPRTSTFSLIYYYLVWVLVLIMSAMFIFTHGTEYVSWPRLVPPTDVLFYVGPGYRARLKGEGGIGIPVLDEKRAYWMAQGRKRAESKAEQLEMGNLRKRID